MEGSRDKRTEEKSPLEPGPYCSRRPEDARGCPVHLPATHCTGHCTCMYLLLLLLMQMHLQAARLCERGN